MLLGLSANLIGEMSLKVTKFEHKLLLMCLITTYSCIEFKNNDFNALVFHFMANGSLENKLHLSIFNRKNEKKKLSYILETKSFHCDEYRYNIYEL